MNSGDAAVHGAIEQRYDRMMASSPHRRRGFGRVALVLAIVFSAVLVSPLGAHTEVFERAPVGGQAVGGTVDQIDISFWAPVLSSNITVVDPSGNEVVTDITRLTTNDRIATTTFPELTEEGRYVVTHSELAPDGDLQTAEWFFVFDSTSENRLVPLSGAGGGPNWILLTAVSGVVLILAGLLWPKRAKTPAAA